jgi:hypothetical protein
VSPFDLFMLSLFMAGFIVSSGCAGYGFGRAYQWYLDGCPGTDPDHPRGKP